MSDQKRVRQELGFRDDAEWLASLSGRAGTNDDMGILASPSEQSEIARRTVSSSAIPGIAAALDSDHFAGIWLDQAAGGTIMIAFTTDPTDEDLRTIAALTPAHGVVKSIRTATSLLALQATADSVSADMISGATPVLFYYSAVVPDRNSVVISVPKATTDAVVGEIEQRYGHNVEVTRGDPYFAAATSTR